MEDLLWGMPSGIFGIMVKVVVISIVLLMDRKGAAFPSFVQLMLVKNSAAG